MRVCWNNREIFANSKSLLARNKFSKTFFQKPFSKHLQVLFAEKLFKRHTVHKKLSPQSRRLSPFFAPRRKSYMLQISHLFCIRKHPSTIRWITGVSAVIVSSWRYLLHTKCTPTSFWNYTYFETWTSRQIQICRKPGCLGNPLRKIPLKKEENNCPNFENTMWNIMPSCFTRTQRNVRAPLPVGVIFRGRVRMNLQSPTPFDRPTRFARPSRCALPTRVAQPTGAAPPAPPTPPTHPTYYCRYCPEHNKQCMSKM